ncbi:secretin N-terminal domain-containing protein [Pseudanabaena sp. ABRG5-3]|uniref:secretin N-terminal domain-containing protein n=1 Tax=Pseudanabaena sp. ABRG5-3 TaxID=685565 RepID=UPI000DC70F3D|nr:secretin N-terminal domain-containing protein [Pseudanabaena sp. ABRG5-3]BBC22902.1 bacterial type II and III secretion system protein [Pseudanabaena sp. ABRG5-3]
MNAKLNDRLDKKLSGKSLACWFLIAASCPQALAIAPSQAQSQTQVSANQSDVVAVASRITDINTSVTGDRLNLTLNFASSDRPQVTYTRQGKSWVAVLNGAQLQLGNGNASYTQANPMPGITSIEATQYAANKVRIRVNTVDPEVLKELIKRQDTGDSLVLSLETQPSAIQSSSISSANAPESGVVNSQQNPSETNKVLTAQATTAPSSFGKPLFEPKITITSADGKTRVAQTSDTNTVPPPVANPVTPQLPGRVPGVVPPFRQLRTPPVGDIATSSTKLRPDIVDLGTAERVPRITLREAPAIEVLTLIGRVAGLSVVSAEPPAAAGAAPTAGATTGLKQPVSLSIENETAQDVFNNVLRISGLEANRIGQTIFVATKLPVTLKNLVTKSYRLNQITVGEASAYLLGLGASRVVNRQRPIPGAQAASVSSGTTVVNTPTEAVPTLETITVGPETGATPLLKGLQVIAEERSSSITLIGTPQQIAFAETQLARLDLRRPQVAVNVKIVDISLNRDQTIGSILGFNASNTDGSGTGTALSANSGTLAINFNSLTTPTVNGTTPPSIFANPQRLFSLIAAKIQSNSGKVISEPTLVVQEGQTGQIDIGDEILTVGTSGNVEKSTAGLKLSVNISKIDDNGFINLSILPEVSVIGSSRIIDTRIRNADGTVVSGFFGAVDLLTKRAISSGQIRMRDGQSLVLSGVIQDTDRESVSKVPFLGDLPIIGTLFRSTQSTNTRAEVVIIVTPRIIDDSQNANWGYTYQPGPEVQKVLDSNQRKSQ